MNFRVIFPGRNWTFQLANSLNKIGKLESFVGTYPKFLTRKYGLPDNKVKSLLFIEILRRVV